ncbi:MAG: hypothetical protein ACP5NX_02735 [Candidatus Bilamarchaeaceae archaeon]
MENFKIFSVLAGTHGSGAGISLLDECRKDEKLAGRVAAVACEILENQAKDDMTVFIRVIEEITILFNHGLMKDDDVRMILRALKGVPSDENGYATSSIATFVNFIGLRGKLLLFGHDIIGLMQQDEKRGCGHLFYGCVGEHLKRILEDRDSGKDTAQALVGFIRHGIEHIPPAQDGRDVLVAEMLGYAEAAQAKGADVQELLPWAIVLAVTDRGPAGDAAADLLMAYDGGLEHGIAVKIEDEIRAINGKMRDGLTQRVRGILDKYSKKCEMSAGMMLNARDLTAQMPGPGDKTVILKPDKGKPTKQRPT